MACQAAHGAPQPHLRRQPGLPWCRGGPQVGQCLRMQDVHVAVPVLFQFGSPVLELHVAQLVEVQLLRQHCAVLGFCRAAECQIGFRDLHVLRLLNAQLCGLHHAAATCLQVSRVLLS